MHAIDDHICCAEPSAIWPCYLLLFMTCMWPVRTLFCLGHIEKGRQYRFLKKKREFLQFALSDWKNGRGELVPPQNLEFNHCLGPPPLFLSSLVWICWIHLDLHVALELWYIPLASSQCMCEHLFVPCLVVQLSSIKMTVNIALLHPGGKYALDLPSSRQPY